MCYGEALSAAVVRARKQHECDDCGRTIQPGRAYHRSAAKVDGDLVQSKLCRTCYLALEDAQGPGECYWFGDGASRDSLRSEPWRQTIAWMRDAWKRARGKASEVSRGN